MSKPKHTGSQRKRKLKKARDARAASRDYVTAFQEDARAVIPRRVLVDETSFSVFTSLPTDSEARVAVLATPVKRTRIVRGVVSLDEALASYEI